ncbi:hypothetical protein FOVG_12955 [Fusarium oxysporum f. sp. pisi HDV247]|uniref:Uncharacterized protein n=2 Tax=Fusarium oxysporum TaxID=5507 RepID=W9NSL3_FUSOX|nr:hypothetical protein FOVG_12955 [Fusarium oxysporum f. sp. pisi HDV247]EXA35830.1 hypothetical protein FOVG_12955 [Fusarium oxysporum f. sp. pisi HDV247]
MIWALVLRDNHPGVHIFGHYDENKKGAAEGRSMMHGNLFSGLLSEPPHRYFDNLDKDRENVNISTYLSDGAMWTTCKESRLAIEKRFNDVDWYFVGSRPTKGGVRPPFRRFQHIAIEYNPEWSVEKREPSDLWEDPAIGHLLEAAFELKDIQKLWFIDHSLKRKKDAPAFKERADCWRALNAFYARDRKFLEIDWRSFSGTLEDWEYHVQILRITTVIKKFNNNSTMASKKTDIKPGKAGKALRDVSSETKSRNSSTSTIASAASSAAATTLTTPSGVRKPDRKRTGTSAHAEEMSSWLLARAAKRQLDKQALEAEVAKLDKWISDDVEKAAGWKITAEKLTNKEAGSSIDVSKVSSLLKRCILITLRNSLPPRW